MGDRRNVLDLRQRDAASPPEDLDAVRLLWTDPPFGTGKTQRLTDYAYRDAEDTEYVANALRQWVPKMADDGTIVVCCDYRFAADAVFAIQEVGLWIYRGEIIWEFALGRPRTSWWPVRHNNLMTFTKTKTSGLFDASAMPRMKRLSQALHRNYKGKEYDYPEDRPMGSVWDFTPPAVGSTRVGYPNQKPLEIIEPFVLAHTRPGDLVVDPFMGSGSTGAAALKHGRRFYGSDANPDAVEIATKRLSDE